MKLFVPLFIMSLLVFSCKKENVKDEAPSLIGTWKHYSAADAWHIIYIYENGNGKMEWFTNSKLNKDTKERTWYLKENTIYFGKMALNGELYEVIDFPTTQSTQTIENLDTLKANVRFMKLDEGYFVEQ